MEQRNDTIWKSSRTRPAACTAHQEMESIWRIRAIWMIHLAKLSLNKSYKSFDTEFGVIYGYPTKNGEPIYIYFLPGKN